MEALSDAQPIVEVTTHWDYAAQLRKFNKFWLAHTNVKRFVISGCLMLLIAAMSALAAVLTEAWLLLLLTLACAGFSVYCFVQYQRGKGNAIEAEMPKLRDQQFVWSPALIGAFIGVMISRGSDSEHFIYFYLAFLFVFLLVLVISLLRAKKNFKAQTYTCTFYESYLFFSYNALEMLVQKGIPYAVCLAQETQDTFYVEFPAERNGSRTANPYYDCVVLEKQGLESGQADTLRELFTRAFGEKFKTIL